MKKLAYATLIVSLMLLSAVPTQATSLRTAPANTIGFGDPSGCTESAIITALNAGGYYNFNCGTTPDAILFSHEQQVTKNTSFDGGGVITFSGDNITRLFNISPGVAMTLTHITISNGSAVGDGGAIYNSGKLTVLASTFTKNHADSADSGGAIISYGILNISNSTFDQNDAGNGGALYARFAAATTNITGTVFTNNKTTNTTNGWGGAILLWDGTQATIRYSHFADNHAQSGGAIYVFPNSNLQVFHSQIAHNEINAADTTDIFGGGIYNGGLLNLVASIVENNLVDEPATFQKDSNRGGGGVYNAPGATLTLDHSVISGNTARIGGGIDTYGELIMTQSTLDGNTAVFGGGLANRSPNTVLVQVNFSSLIHNTITLDGFQTNYQPVGAAIWNQGKLDAANTTIAGNTTQVGILAVDNTNGMLNFNNVTIANNDADGGLGAQTSPNTGQVTLVNTLLANNSPYNCGFIQWTTFTAQNSLSSDSSCKWTGSQNITGTDPQLGPLEPNGGVTLTMLPAAASPVIDAGAGGAACPAFDQRLVTRPQRAACDIGAVERMANDVMEIVYLPLLIK